ncbi:MAG: ribonucleoside-diphosphate reductase [Gammaproteobacteria bacterium]|nr:MAG: ribonucleoside-diphosphate reductase [Gammaproteobacteria bacterium]
MSTADAMPRTPARNDPTASAPDVADGNEQVLPLQDTSLDIWDRKYRLKTKSGECVDETVADTWRRVARALADVEIGEDARAKWFDRFLWALEHGAIPAGRITSNAGALAHKPATSTINCTVSGSIDDSMDDILAKVHEAGLTLKAGCGIGYDFSTLRPRGAYVSGAGAYTSGPLSFMDIFDRMCFTVSSAGGRRGAQMGTFDVRHPDVLEFIKAKREDGRLRQFNLSLLITEDFVQAVKTDEPWQLAFPIREKELAEGDINLDDPDEVVWRDWPNHNRVVTNADGLVACRVYRTLPARRLWDLIMASTYDFAEPGFILIDKVNEMNNNWFDETIRATNPCVTADTWVHTSDGPRQVAELVGTPFVARVDGADHATGPEGFFRTATREVVELRAREGQRLRLTADHRVRRVVKSSRFHVETAWCEAGQLLAGDQILLHDHRANTTWAGALSAEEGYLLGLLVAGGTLQQETAVLSIPAEAAVMTATANGANDANGNVSTIIEETERCLAGLDHGTAPAAFTARVGRDGWCAQSASLRDLAFSVGMQAGDTRGGTRGGARITAALEKASSDACRAFLRGCFDARGAVQDNPTTGVSVQLAQSDLASLEAAQRMLARLGIPASIHEIHHAVRSHPLSDDTRGQHHHASAMRHELVIDGDSLVEFAAGVGFTHPGKAAALASGIGTHRRRPNRARFVATVETITPAGTEAVYDVQVPGINTFDANGLHAHNCGEQPLPPYGACLLGSVNLTRFVREPFTPQARFDWDEYHEVVAVFTRMLDNVVEINGLPLPAQREEIHRKRRHGMGFLGLGSTLTLLGMKYGSEESLAFTEKVSREMAIAGWETALELADEKGAAPIMDESFTVTGDMLRRRPEMKSDGYEIGDQVKGRVLHAKYSRYMQQVAEVAPELVEKLAERGARFTHHSSIAPTGTISLSLANNASNGIEPSFAHHYARNVIREGRKTKEKVDVFSYELLAYQAFVNPRAMPCADSEDARLPDYFITADDITPKQHVDVQAAAQRWIDSSISKTANVPTDFPFDDFKDIYLYAHEKGLKGCTTFRFNPEAFQGVLVKEQDLENTEYEFTLEDGSVVVAKGNETIEYDGEIHTAANLYDALKEGYYGKF